MDKERITKEELCEIFHQTDYKILFESLIMFEFKGCELDDEILDLAFEEYIDNEEYTGLIPTDLRQDIIEIIKKVKGEEI